MDKVVFCISLLAVLGCASRASANMVPTRACWLRPPYGLLKSYGSEGPYKAELIRGREPASAWEWTHDGIVYLETVQLDVERLALAGRYAVMELAGGGVFRYAVVDLADGRATPVLLEGEPELRRYLGARG